MNDLYLRPSGYVQVSCPATRKKLYKAVLRDPQKRLIRLAKRRFRRALDAKVYGVSLAQRYTRLVNSLPGGGIAS